MRVISGIAKGRRLRTTGAPEMRPTTDMARKTIFDILGDKVAGARVVDLFAGAGTLGIEALSRGAEECVFVEQARDACSTILSNLEVTGLRSSGIVARADVVRWLAKQAETPFDLAFLDPPYDRGLRFVGRVIGRIAAGGWLRPGGTVVVEAEVGSIEWPAGFHEIRARRFGRTQVSMAERHDGADGDLSRDV